MRIFFARLHLSLSISTLSYLGNFLDAHSTQMNLFWRLDPEQVS